MSCGSKKTAEQVEQEKKSKKINSDLKAEEKQVKTHMKLLLLGTGDSGKSTFAKQMSLVHNSGFTDFHMDTFIPILRENCLSGMQTILHGVEDRNIQLPKDVQPTASRIMSATDLTVSLAEDIDTLCKCKEIQKLLERGEDLQLQGGIAGVSYYFQNAKRFADASFKPNKEDILKARRKTTGIVETLFQVEGIQFTMVDVGGQRSERKKWLHCFGSVNSVIYLTAINEFDMVLEEDSKTNRLIESLKLWRALTNSQFFKTTPFILFLNKSDLFNEKIKKIPLVEIFEDFAAFSKSLPDTLSDFDKGWKYIAKQYQAHFAGSTFYPHVTCAIDTKNCHKVFESVRETLTRNTFEKSGL